MEKMARQDLLTTAFVDIISSMNIPDNQISQILKQSPDYMEKLRTKEIKIELKDDLHKSVTKFIFAMENLYILVGKKPEEAANWLNKPNYVFDNKTPMEVMESGSEGIDRVLSYLKDANNR